VRGKPPPLFTSKVKKYTKIPTNHCKNSLFLVYNFVTKLNTQKMGENYFENCSNT
jgi:hypothetical protein